MFSTFGLAFGRRCVSLSGWLTVGTQETITGGDIILSGLNLSGLAAVQVVLSGVKATDDDDFVFIRAHVSGAKVSTGYRWGTSDVSSGGTEILGSSAAATGVQIADSNTNWGLGNASTESLFSIITIFEPASASLYKTMIKEALLVLPSGNAGKFFGGGVFENTGAIDGFTVEAGSALTAGKMILFGIT